MPKEESISSEVVFRVACTFDEDLQSALMRAIFDYQTAEEKKRSRILAGLFGVFTLLGFGFAYLQGGTFTFGHVIIFGCGFFLFVGLLFLSQLGKQRNEFVASEVNRWKSISSEKKETIFELTEDSLSIIDPDVCVTYQWSYFIKCMNTGKYLFLHDNAGKVTGISSAILGVEHFKEAVAIISQNVRAMDIQESQPTSSQPNELLDEKRI